MSEAPKTRRRWFQFGLRSLFIAVALAAIVAVWVAGQLDWIRQRQEIIAEYPTGGTTPGFRAPGLLWLFGEPGIEEVYMRSRIKAERERLQRPFHEQEEREEVERVRRLFPEAIIQFPQGTYYKTVFPDAPVPRDQYPDRPLNLKPE